MGTDEQRRQLREMWVEAHGAWSDGYDDLLDLNPGFFERLLDLSDLSLQNLTYIAIRHTLHIAGIIRGIFVGIRRLNRHHLSPMHMRSGHDTRSLAYQPHASMRV